MIFIIPVSLAGLERMSKSGRKGLRFMPWRSDEKVHGKPLTFNKKDIPSGYIPLGIPLLLLQTGLQGLLPA